MRKLRKPINKDLLKKLYIQEGKSSTEISKILNIPFCRIIYQLRKYGFNIRNSGSMGNEIKIDKNELYKLYVLELKTLKEIGKKYKVSAATIKNFMNKYGLGEYTKKYRPRFSIRGNNHPTKRPEVKLKMSNNHYNCAGRNNPHFGKLALHGKRIFYKNTNFRSSWEYKLAQWLDKYNIKWLYEYKTFDLENMTYTPDFYIPEFNLYIEVKGFWRDRAKEKFEVFKQKYPYEKLLLLKEKELKENKII